jgi:hypothetical protein
VISQKLYTILEAMEAVEMKDDGNTSQIGSPVGEVIEVTGSTKVNLRWFDHEGENVRKRIEFKVIPGLYPDMIFKPTTFQELGMLLAADTWPRDDPRKGFLMFNTPWLGSKQKEQNKKQHEIKKAANAARAAQERRDRKEHKMCLEGAREGARMYRCFAPGCTEALKGWPRKNNLLLHLIKAHPNEDVYKLTRLSEEWWNDPLSFPPFSEGSEGQ